MMTSYYTGVTFCYHDSLPLRSDWTLNTILTCVAKGKGEKNVTDLWSIYPVHLLPFVFSPFAAITEGLNDVILYHQPDDKKKNRGFCFLEYEDHKTAAQARRRLMSGKVKVWGNVVTVEWADPIEDPDPEVMAKVMHFLCVTPKCFSAGVFISLSTKQKFNPCVLSPGQGAVCEKPS